MKAIAARFAYGFRFFCDCMIERDNLPAHQSVRPELVEGFRLPELFEGRSSSLWDRLSTNGKKTEWASRFSLLLCFFLFGPVHADEVFDHPQSAEQLLKGPLARPAAALHGAQVMRGKFVYKKYLKEIPQPLISRGEFVFARELGIDWHTREPFDSDFVLTATGITQRDDGKTTLQMSASEQPAVKVVARIFLALLSLDVASLQNSFALSGTQLRNDKWQVGLRPTVTAVSSVFKEAIVSGGAQVETLLLRDANGDRTEINFSDVQYASSIASAERALFAGKAK